MDMEAPLVQHFMKYKHIPGSFKFVILEIISNIGTSAVETRR